MPPFVDALHLPLPSPLRPIFHQQSLDRVNVIYFTHKGAMINGLLWQRYITTPLKKCKHTRSRLNLIQTRSNPADITLIVHSTSVFDMCALARIGSPIELFIPGLSPTFVRKKIDILDCGLKLDHLKISISSNHPHVLYPCLLD